MNEITIDIDVNYTEFCVDKSQGLLRDLRRVGERHQILSTQLRKSSGGRTHVRVRFFEEISLFESLCIRAFLNDDPHRLACDLTRYFMTGNIEDTGRCFNEKYTKGKLRKATKWQDIKDLGFI